MSEAKNVFLWHWRNLHPDAPQPETEFRFDRQRRWRFDLAWPRCMVAVEIEGGVWARGRHTRGAGFTLDIEKYNAAVLAGWRLLRFTPQMIENDPAGCCETVLRLLDEA